MALQGRLHPEQETKDGVKVHSMQFRLHLERAKPRHTSAPCQWVSCNTEALAEAISAALLAAFAAACSTICSFRDLNII